MLRPLATRLVASLGAGLVAAVVPTLGLIGCVDEADVAVRNATAEEVLVEISYGGCHWPGPLLPGETTGVCRPFEPVDHVHFRRMGESEISGDAQPAAFPYRTLSRFEADGPMTILTVRDDAIEQDFGAPSPFSH